MMIKAHGERLKEMYAIIITVPISFLIVISAVSRIAVLRFATSIIGVVVEPRGADAIALTVVVRLKNRNKEELLKRKL